MKEQLYRFVKVSERLPEKRDYYSVKVQYDGKVYPEGCQYSVKDKMWGKGLDGNVIEWLEPLPETSQEEAWKKFAALLKDLTDFDIEKRATSFSIIKQEYLLIKR